MVSLTVLTTVDGFIDSTNKREAGFADSIDIREAGSFDCTYT